MESAYTRALKRLVTEDARFEKKLLSPEQRRRLREIDCEFDRLSNRVRAGLVQLRDGNGQHVGKQPSSNELESRYKSIALERQRMKERYRGELLMNFVSPGREQVHG